MITLKVNMATSQNYGSNKLVIWKMKDETSGVATEEFVRLNLKMYSFLVDDNSEHKESKRHE